MVRSPCLPRSLSPCLLRTVGAILNRATLRYAMKVLSMATSGLLLFSAVAQACPMCSQSIAEENLLPHAYMYSIIFMLSMPAMVFTGIGSFIFFQYRKATAPPPAPIAADECPEASLHVEAEPALPL